MPESVYKVIELVGTSTDSWEAAAKAAVDRAGQTLRDLRVAEVVQLDLSDRRGRSRAVPREGASLVQVRRRLST